MDLNKHKLNKLKQDISKLVEVFKKETNMDIVHITTENTWFEGSNEVSTKVKVSATINT